MWKTFFVDNFSIGVLTLTNLKFGGDDRIRTSGILWGDQRGLNPCCTISVRDASPPRTPQRGPRSDPTRLSPRRTKGTNFGTPSVAKAYPRDKPILR